MLQSAKVCFALQTLDFLIKIVLQIADLRRTLLSKAAGFCGARGCAILSRYFILA
jgi:hypothetical protein